MFTFICFFTMNIKGVQNNYQKYFLSKNWSCNKKVITMGVFVYDFYRSDMISATCSLRSVRADITSSLMDKNHIQIHPWYNLYLYMLINVYFIEIPKCNWNFFTSHVHLSHKAGIKVTTYTGLYWMFMKSVNYSRGLNSLKC